MLLTFVILLPELVAPPLPTGSGRVNGWSGVGAARKCAPLVRFGRGHRRQGAGLQLRHRRRRSSARASGPDRDGGLPGDPRRAWQPSTQAVLEEQLGHSLPLLAGGLRAGHSLPQSIDALVHESVSPTREEFVRVRFEVQLGHSLLQAMRNLADRIGGEDLEWVAEAVEIERDISGDLARPVSADGG